MQGKLIPLYEEMHKRGLFYGHGGTLKRYTSEIAKIVAVEPTESILDYGCGRGINYINDKMHMSWGGIMPTLYDPAVKAFNRLPAGKFDGVICTGVLEHIPRDELDQAFVHLAGYAQKWCLLVIGCRPSNKRLPDGSPVHVTLRPRSWWWRKIKNAFGLEIQEEPDLEKMERKKAFEMATRPIRLHLSFE